MNIRSHLKRLRYEWAGALNYFGVKVYFPKKSFLFNEVCEHGIWEKDNLKILAALVRPDTTYIDVGANIGLLSIPLLSYYSDIKVVSYEPSPNTFPHLARTATQSCFTSRWKIVNRAIGAGTGKAEFFTHSPDFGAWDGLRPTNRVGDTSKVSIAMTTLDKEWEEMGKPTISVIKVDVEGAELQALEGAQECLAHCKPSVLLEWNNANLSAFDCPPESLLAFAKRNGYAIFSLPELMPVKTFMCMQLQMLRTESFLLCALDPHPDWLVNYRPFRGL